MSVLKTHAEAICWQAVAPRDHLWHAAICALPPADGRLAGLQAGLANGQREQHPVDA